MKINVEFDNFNELDEFIKRLRTNSVDRELVNKALEREPVEFSCASNIYPPYGLVSDEPTENETFNPFKPEPTSTVSQNDSEAGDQVIQSFLQDWFNRYGSSPVRVTELLPVLAKHRDLCRVFKYDPDVKSNTGHVGVKINQFTKRDLQPFNVAAVRKDNGNTYVLTKAREGSTTTNRSYSKPVSKTSETPKPSIMLSLPDINESERDTEKLINVWYERYQNREVRPFQLIALAKEFGLFKPLSYEDKSNAIRVIGKKLGKYYKSDITLPYFVDRSSVQVTKNGKPTAETRYNLIKNDKYQNGLHPNKIVVSSQSVGESNFPKGWLDALDVSISNKRQNFHADELITTDSDTKTRMSFFDFLRKNRNLSYASGKFSVV